MSAPEVPLSTFPLSPAVFQSLLAIGWIDGELVAAERDAILDAARQAGLSDEAVSELEAMAQTPVTFADMDFDALTAAERLFVYAVASWVAQADAQVTGDERAALHAIGTLLALTSTGRRAMDVELRAAGRLGRRARTDRSAAGHPRRA